MRLIVKMKIPKDLIGHIYSGESYPIDKFFFHEFDDAYKQFAMKVFAEKIFMINEDKDVDIKDLYPSQERVIKSIVHDEDWDVPPTVIVNEEGKMIVDDGHHRVARKILKGLTKIKVTIVYRGC